MKPRVVRPVQALLVVGLLSAGLHAQSVGIGTSTPHPSARLHISDNARGLLIPNVELTATNVAAPVTNPATSLLVYNTNTAGTGATAVTPGFYYWDGNQWVRLADGGKAWLLTGNAGTNPATNFLGTTDAQPLVIRTNNTEWMRVTANGNVGIGTTAPSERLDVQGNVRFSGALMPGGNAGTSGQVLVSQGAGTAPVWQPLSSLVTNAWLLTGNAGTNPAVNFLGTTDAQPLVIRVGNQETFRFNPPGGSAPAWSIQRGGGNQRGWHAVDLQSARTAATQVASGDYSVIGGGRNNTASGGAVTIGGGTSNTASIYGATVGGGDGNTASGGLATVGGGLQNTASGFYATVGGGYLNTASGAYATVGGGWQNTASGDHSVVLGGTSNTANARSNLVFGDAVVPSVTETYRVYFFGPGGFRPSGFLVINRLDGDHPIHVGTDGTNGNGARLTTGGVWTNGSSRSFKERFVQYRPAEVLEKILQLPVEGYFYKGTQEYHITPMAEDFYRLFGTGVHEIIETDSTGQLVRRPNPDVDKYLAASDVAGVALLGVQALHEENAQLRQRVADLETENAQLRQQISDTRTENAALRARLEQLEALVQKIASTQTSR